MPEMLVVMGQIAVLTAVVAPSVFSQIDKAERHRLVGDLRGVTQAAELFQVDVGRWPGSVEQMLEPITTGHRDAEQRAYTSREASRWAGPYLAHGKVSEAPESGGDELGPPTMSVGSWKGRPFLRLAVGGVDLETARWVSRTIDGDTLVGDDGHADEDGRVRWKRGAVDSLVYLARPLD